MPFSRRRLVFSAVAVSGLLVVALLLRLGFQWRQAIADIDSMIVTSGPVDVQGGSSFQYNEWSTADFLSKQSARMTHRGGSSQPVAVQPAPTLTESTLNILLLGTDARPGDVDPTRTDAIILVRIDRDNGRVSMLSLPRDLWVTYPTGTSGRINAAYAVGELQLGAGGGAAVAKATVGRLLNLEVDNYVMLNFESFRNLIDYVGGIEVDVPEAIFDPKFPTEDYGLIEVRFDAGQQWFDGERALTYARTRNVDSDFGRNQRQQLVLIAIFERLSQRGMLDRIIGVDNYTQMMRGYVQTDLSRRQILALANFAGEISIEDLHRYAIDSRMIVELKDPATFAAEPVALRRVVREFTGEVVSTAGGN